MDNMDHSFFMSAFHVNKTLLTNPCFLSSYHLRLLMMITVNDN